LEDVESLAGFAILGEEAAFVIAELLPDGEAEVAVEFIDLSFAQGVLTRAEEGQEGEFKAGEAQGALLAHEGDDEEVGRGGGEGFGGGGFERAEAPGGEAFQFGFGQELKAEGGDARLGCEGVLQCVALRGCGQAVAEGQPPEREQGREDGGQRNSFH
jgi:hypothetical protein